MLPPAGAYITDGLLLRRRRIDIHSGHALEMLGHAIEYLADEILNEGNLPTAGDDRVQAMEILKALNRQIYFECPVVPTLHDRVHSLFHSMVDRENDPSPKKKRR